MSFVSELKRRKVFQVAAVYLVVAWLIMQVVDVVNEPLRLPEWFATVAILLVAIGFPIALITSWAFDLTPEGVVKDTGTVQSSGRRIEYVLIGLLVIAVGWLAYRVELSPSEQAAEVAAEETQRDVLPNSVAVLPFDNMSANPDDAFFAAGIHDEILNRLAKIQDLNVIARTSVLQYAGAARPITEIARELNVGSVMEGSVSYAEGRVVVRAQLIDSDTGVHLWSDSYNRQFRDIFTIQAEIAANIANALEAEFSLAEQQSIEKALTDSPEAYAYYLRAINSLDEEGNVAALGYLDQAIAIDPNFAVAYAHRARSHAKVIVNSSGGSAVSPRERTEATELALEDAGRALALNPSLGLAHMARVRIDAYAWRSTEAQGHLERALQSSPNDPTVLREYALFESIIGNPEEGVRQGRRAVELDPGNWWCHWYLGLASAFAGDGAGAVVAFREAISQDATAIVRMGWYGAFEARFGDAAEGERAVRLHEQFISDDSDVGPAIAPRRAYSYNQLGLSDDAMRVFNEFENWALDHPTGAGDWALSYLAIGDTEHALQWLNRAAGKMEANEPDEGFWPLMLIRSNVFSDPILDQPEFVEVRSRLGFRQ